MVMSFLSCVGLGSPILFSTGGFLAPLNWVPVTVFGGSGGIEN